MAESRTKFVGELAVLIPNQHISLR